MSLEDKVKQNTEKLKAHGAIHLGEEIANLEPKAYRGAGGITRAAMNKPPNSRYSMVDRSGIISGAGSLAPI